MIKSKFKRVTSLFLATLMCVTTFAGIGSTTAYAASGEKADVYMVDFPRDGDANYDGVWGHSNLTLKNGWHTGRSNFTNLKAIGSYSGNVAYCIEPGISLKVGQTMNKYDENYFNNLAANKDGEFVTDTTLMKGYWYDFIFNFFKDSLAGVTFDVYAKEDIVSADGLDTVYHKAGDKVATIVTNDKGIARIDDLPLGQYYVKEIEAPKGYVKSDKIFDVDASYQGDKVKVIEFEAAFENAPIKVEISKTDITGEKELPGAKLSVIDADGKLVESWTSEAGKTHMIERLPVGKYTLREESAPYGYKVASDVTFEVKETAEIQKVSMKDEQAVGKIVIEKTDKVTGKPIDGVVFEVRDKDGKVLDTLTTDKNGHAESKELPICTYNEDGSFKEDIHYTVVETKAADGYILDETAHDVTLRYDDNAPDVVVTTLKLINVPTEPKLPQTGDNANPLLYLGIGALALITGVGVGLRGRKKKNKQ